MAPRTYPVAALFMGAIGLATAMAQVRQSGLVLDPVALTQKRRAPVHQYPTEPRPRHNITARANRGPKRQRGRRA